MLKDRPKLGETFKTPGIVEENKPGTSQNSSEPDSAPSSGGSAPRTKARIDKDLRDTENSVESEFDYFKRKAGVYDTNNELINPKKQATDSWMNKYAFISYGGSYLDGSSSNVKNDFVGEGDSQISSMGLNVDISKWQNPSTKNIIEWSKSLRVGTPQATTYDPTGRTSDTAGSEGDITKDSAPQETGKSNFSDSQTTSKGTIKRGDIGKEDAGIIANQSASGNTIKGIGNLEYTWKDFASCKYWSRIPNNKLITLRRFKLPVLDNGVIAGKEKLKGILKKTIYEPEEYISSDSARALTYFGEGTGNSLNDFLGWTTGQNWTDVETTLANPKINEGLQNSGANFLNNPIDGSALVNKFGDATSQAIARTVHAWGLQKQLKDKDGKQKYGSLLELVRKQSKDNDPFSNGWQNRIYGPINVVTRTMRRTRGLKFDPSDISIDFEYDLAQIGDMNNKILMLDIINNMLALTSNNGSFYGGDYRFHRQPTELPYPDTLVDQLEKMATGVGEGEVNYSEIFKAYIGVATDYGGSLFKQLGSDLESLYKDPELSEDVDKLVDGIKKIFEEFQLTSSTNTPNNPTGGSTSDPSDVSKLIPPEGRINGSEGENTLQSLFGKNFLGYASLLSEIPGTLANAIEKLANTDGSVIKTIITGGLFEEGYDIQKINEKIMRINPLTTGEPIGEWHLTIGNPMNPIMMIGNLVCTGMSMELGEVLGPDDFPTTVKFTVTLKHGRDRDIGDIASMFNLGQGRFYTPLGEGRSEEPWDYGFSTRNTGNDTSILDNDTASRVKEGEDGIITDFAPQDISK